MPVEYNIEVPVILQDFDYTFDILLALHLSTTDTSEKLEEDSIF